MRTREVNRSVACNSMAETWRMKRLSTVSKQAGSWPIYSTLGSSVGDTFNGSHLNFFSRLPPQNILKKEFICSWFQLPFYTFNSWEEPYLHNCGERYLELFYFVYKAIMNNEDYTSINSFKITTKN